MRFYVKECVDDAEIRKQLFNILGCGIYADAYIELRKFDLIKFLGCWNSAFRNGVAEMSVKTDLRYVLDFFRNVKDKRKSKELVENDPYYKSMDEDSYDACKCEKLIEVKDEYKDVEGRMNKGLFPIAPLYIYLDNIQSTILL